MVVQGVVRNVFVEGVQKRTVHFLPTPRNKREITATGGSSH